MIRTRGYARKLSGVAFDPPLYDTFAFITRRNAHLSPATREFIRLAEKRVQGLQRQLTAES
jgi:LysR family transcriptional regulator, cyn operon transcriptional activator